jgi:hypothetical protein
MRRFGGGPHLGTTSVDREGQHCFTHRGRTPAVRNDARTRLGSQRSFHWMPLTFRTASRSGGRRQKSVGKIDLCKQPSGRAAETCGSIQYFGFHCRSSVAWHSQVLFRNGNANGNRLIVRQSANAQCRKPS